jgi:hypothetical protein
MVSSAPAAMRIPLITFGLPSRAADLAHGASRDVIARVDGYDNRAPAVGMAHKVVAALYANDSEAGLFQHPDT